jgi:toxin ParE1/3/4
MKRLVFSKDSNYDLRDAVDFYDSKQSGLGDRFFSNLSEKIEKIKSNPLHYAIRYKEVRCAKIDNFPFMVHFIVSDDDIIIIGIIHTSRNPQLWKERK